MKDKICLLPGDFVVAYVGAVPVKMLQIKDIVLDPSCKNRTGWWVTFTNDALPFQFSWQLNDEHIHGEEFTISGVPHKLVLAARPNEVAPGEEKKENVVPSKHITLDSNRGEF